MKNILLPTDFSENAWNAIAYALQLFKNENCTFYILHTYTPKFYRVDYMLGGPAFSAVADAGVDIAQAGLEKTLEDIQLKFPNEKHRFKTLSAFNLLTEEVTEVLAREPIDLIVMGTQGATGAKEIFLGTHTVHIIRESSVPVLAVPSGYDFKPIHSIVFPTDFGATYQEDVMQFLIEIVQMNQAKLIVLHIKEDAELSMDQETNKANLTNHLATLENTFIEVDGKFMPEAIHEYIDQHDCGFLAMINREHSFIERLFIKQTIDAIGFHTKVPFLVLKDSTKI